MFININFTGLSERVIHFLFFEMKFIKRNKDNTNVNNDTPSEKYFSNFVFSLFIPSRINEPNKGIAKVVINNSTILFYLFVFTY